jgi:putative membrane protein
MKTSIHPALAAIAALGVAFSPVLIAQQTAAPDQSQNTRAADSTADQHAADTGSPASQPGTLDKNNSKDAASETRDANPGTASSDSAAQSGTKDSTTADANNSAKDTVTHHAEKPLSDKEFVAMASQGGMTEVELGKVAGEKGDSSAVKDFGARMVKDHTQANDELKGIADKKGLPIASSLDARHQAMVDRMSKLSGPAFDKAYVNGMVRDHDKTVALFKQEAESGQDPDLKAFASKTLPTLEDHCSSIKSIKDSGVK